MAGNIKDRIKQNKWINPVAHRLYYTLIRKKAQLYERIYVRRELPALPFEVDHIGDLDGIKVYFRNGGWVIARFSGTEPLLRVFCEMPKREDAAEICRIFETFLLGEAN